MNVSANSGRLKHEEVAGRPFWRVNRFSFNSFIYADYIDNFHEITPCRFAPQFMFFANFGVSVIQNATFNIAHVLRRFIGIFFSSLKATVTRSARVIIGAWAARWREVANPFPSH